MTRRNAAQRPVPSPRATSYKVLSARRKAAATGR
jgi:hypothetical protein